MRMLTTIQETIYLTQEIYAGSALYNVGGYASLEGELNKRALIRSIAYVLANADILASGYDITEIDLSDSDDPVRACLDWMHTDIHEPFDLNSRLFTVRILKAQDRQYYWYVKAHHLVFDGYSMALFFNKVAAIYSIGVKQE